ncbi:MAG: tryptophan--tRNA ligase [Gammaproteobacteria bacterium]|nr:tryptophan--tRNA ligase [Gammaproteobacteria bacterium]
MNSVLPGQPARVLSGMRPTGRLHLGHYHGVLKNWLKLQTEYECFFFIADWHALTTHYEESQGLQEHVWDMATDWLAAGVDPSSATLFLQSCVPAHAELHLLLSMITPLPWLERVPSYKDQQAQMPDRDLSTYGFLGYPLLQGADILIYRAGLVPVGEDQVAHVELTREVARRFNHLYGREPGYKALAEEAIQKLGKKNSKLYRELRQAFLEQGDKQALITARALLERQKNMTLGNKERLFGYLEGGGRLILPEPEALLTHAPKMPGLDGRKMSKSYANTISLREDPLEVEQKLKTMSTDPARVRRGDPGNPEKCPVWEFHKVYSDDKTRQWVDQGCRSAGIGCLECKRPVIDAVLAELKPIQERVAEFARDPLAVRSIVEDGCKRARDVAEETLVEVRNAMGLGYSS